MLKKLILMFPPLNMYLTGWKESGVTPPNTPEGRAIKALIELTFDEAPKAQPKPAKKHGLIDILEKGWI